MLVSPAVRGKQKHICFYCFLVLELALRLRMMIELNEQQNPSSVASDSKSSAQFSSLLSQEQWITMSEQFGDN